MLLSSRLQAHEGNCYHGFEPASLGGGRLRRGGCCRDRRRRDIPGNQSAIAAAGEWNCHAADPKGRRPRPTRKTRNGRARLTENNTGSRGRRRPNQRLAANTGTTRATVCTRACAARSRCFTRRPNLTRGPAGRAFINPSTIQTSKQTSISACSHSAPRCSAEIARHIWVTFLTMDRSPRASAIASTRPRSTFRIRLPSPRPAATSPMRYALVYPLFTGAEQPKLGFGAVTDVLQHALAGTGMRTSFGCRALLGPRAEQRPKTNPPSLCAR